MRKLVASNLLLLMFTVGAASGFLVSVTGWWGQRLGARHLERLYHAAGEQDRQSAYLNAIAATGEAQTILFGMFLLATLSFCLTAWVSYRKWLESRRKAAQLDEEHALFRTLFEGTSDGVLLLCGDRIVDCNRAALRLFGAEDLQQMKACELDCLQPATQPDGIASAVALRERISDSQLEGQRFEWLLHTLDGKEFPAELAINTAQVGARHIVQITVRDITRRKQAEMSMRLANQAFENALEGIAITDAYASILMVNTAFTTITGYAAEEVAGRNPRILSSGRQTKEFYETMWRSIAEQGKWQGEIWNMRKNGEIYPQWLNISAMKNDQGKVSNYVAIFSDISERKSAEERILHQVYYDQLTSLPNRTLFNDRLKQVLGIARRHPGYHFAVMYIDLDRFKPVNDSMGHHAGDELLKQAAHRLRGSVRESDTVARMGGDEFTVLLSEIASPKDAGNVAKKIVNAFSSPFHLYGEDVYISASIGISVYPEDGSSIDALLKAADMAMYRAKGAGGSWYELYDESLGNQASERLRLENGMRSAIERGEFLLHYQPQVDGTTGLVAGVEALVRWKHPELGMVSPAKFIPLAEETGLIVPLGEWILRTACAQASRWQGAGTPLRVAVNVSARQLRQSDFVDMITAILREHRLAPHLLEIELTEGVLMEDTTQTLAMLDRLHDMGVQISIDDFGTGYSSLSYLKRLPIHILKIDQSFVRDIHVDTDDRTIVTAVIALAHSLKLKVVAEGVETPEQQAFLGQHGCDLMQGYLFSRPVPGDDISALLDSLTEPALVS